MIDIKTYIIKNFTKFKVVHSIPGRIRLKINNASKIPKEAAMYDKYVIEGIKILDGIDNIEFNYMTGSVLITYNPNKLSEEIVIKWINHVLNIFLENINFIHEFGEDNIDYVVSTLEKKLKETLSKV